MFRVYAVFDYTTSSVTVSKKKKWRAREINNGARVIIKSDGWSG
ncbi:hypothetical protein HMPREF0208_03095 [Citrobacter koseri]|nr:hypothetical protein HMPREF3207_04765 [Citrobacter koseri]KWZ99262.1 hypothetical protein HMPREF3220_02181 [Citrobacter koseri]KXB42624.1 hypothetical protein HMPREF0208_03095 [Citrobacter koseri]